MGTLRNALGIGPLINAESADSFKGGFSEGDKVCYVVVDITAIGTSVVRVWGRAMGSGQQSQEGGGTQRINTATSGYTISVAFKNVQTGATISGATGAAAVGLFYADVTGLEYGIEHDYTSGGATTAYVSTSVVAR